MDANYGLSKTKNSEIRFRWSTLGVRAEMEMIFPVAVQLLKEQGRMKFVRPLYRTLFKSPKGRAVALDTFKAFRSHYHNIAQKMVAKDLELEA